MRKFRSDKVTSGRTAAAARSLWQAGGMALDDFGKPIIAVANSFTEFVPGHVHLQDVGRLVCDAIWKAGGVPREFNTIAIDDGIAMGGSTNTILHLLAMAQEAEVDFTVADIDRLSRQIPHLCKVSPATPNYHMEDVHRAGGVMAVLGELERAGHIDTSTNSVAGENLDALLARWDYIRSQDPEVNCFYRAAPGGKRTIKPYGQSERWDEMDLDRSNGCIRDIDHPYSEQGGLAVLFGNISEHGCIVKSGAVQKHMYQFSGTARVFDQQETALRAIDNGEIEEGTAIIIRYEGPRGGPGMQEMLKPSMSLKARKIDHACALITDGRYSGASAGLSIGHISPEAANKGALALVRDGDTIDIDIPNRAINVAVSDEVLASRRATMEVLGEDQAWQPQGERSLVITRALRAYAAFATSADCGGFREI